MQARGCQPVSVSASLTPCASFTSYAASARARAWPAATLLLAAVLSACAPMPPATDAAVPSTADAARTERMQQAQQAAAALRAERQSAAAPEANNYELTWPDVDQQGIASWYGPGFHGRKTANGERFNQYELTAAHRTYKFGTQLCVRSKSTGQAVVVRVNDRGPFVKNRVIDLSKAAAEEIGMLGKGVKSVEIYKLDEGKDSCPEAVLAASN